MSGFDISDRLLNSAMVRAGPLSSATEIAYGSGLAYTEPVKRPINGLSKALPGFGKYGFHWRLYSSERRALAHGGRRVRGGDGRLPAHIRQHYSEGERAALSVVAEQVQRFGECRLYIAHIARIARVGVRTVNYALAKAKAMVHLVVEADRPRGSRTNRANRIIVGDISWKKWIGARRSRSVKPACKEAQSYEMIGRTDRSGQEERPESVVLRDPARLTAGAFEGECVAIAAQEPRRRRASG